MLLSFAFHCSLAHFLIASLMIQQSAGDLILIFDSEWSRGTVCGSRWGCCAGPTRSLGLCIRVATSEKFIRLGIFQTKETLQTAMRSWVLNSFDMMTSSIRGIYQQRMWHWCDTATEFLGSIFSTARGDAVTARIQAAFIANHGEAAAKTEVQEPQTKVEKRWSLAL